MNIAAPNPETLSRLIVMQAMMLQFRDSSTLFSFICRGLCDCPGVTAARFDTGHEESVAESGHRIFDITSSRESYGRLVLDVSDPLALENYAPYIHNLAAMIGLLLENRNLNQSLEKIVADKTRDLAEIFDLSPDLICVADINESKFLKINRAFTNILGYEEEELVNHPFSEFIHPDDIQSTDRVVQEQLQQGNDVLGFTNRYRHKDGAWHWLEWQSRPVPERGLTFAVARDITEHKKADELLKETSTKLREANNKIKRAYESSLKNERLKAIGQMASGISHDFNNSLMPVLGISDLILSDQTILEDREETISMVESIRAAAEDATHIVRRLRQVYNPGYTDHYEPVDLVRIVEDSISMTTSKWREEARAIGITITIDTDFCERPMIDGDAAELRETLVNIMFNSVAAMDEDGAISFCIRHDDTDSVILEVTDTGIGMDEEVLEKCMDAFFTTKGPDGSGLGLAQAHGIVERHNGTMSINSQPKHGTTIRMTFPASRLGKRQPVEKQVEDREVPSLSIMVIDDEMRALDLMERMLKRDGHRAQMFKEGAAGIQAFQKEAFDLVITDRAMPGMGGDAVAKEIHRLSPDTPVIMLTGFGDIMNDNEECPIGVSKIVGKPVSLKDLRNAIHSLISVQNKEL